MWLNAKSICLQSISCVEQKFLIILKKVFSIKIVKSYFCQFFPSLKLLISPKRNEIFAWSKNNYFWHVDLLCIFVLFYFLSFFLSFFLFLSFFDYFDLSDMIWENVLLKFLFWLFSDQIHLKTIIFNLYLWTKLSLLTNSISHCNHFNCSFLALFVKFWCISNFCICQKKLIHC